MMIPVCPRLLNMITDFVLLRFWVRAFEDLSAIEVILLLLLLLLYADAPIDASPGNVVAKMQTCTAHNRAIAEPVTCMNNKRWRGCEEKMSQ